MGDLLPTVQPLGSFELSHIQEQPQFQNTSYCFNSTSSHKLSRKCLLYQQFFWTQFNHGVSYSAPHHITLFPQSIYFVGFFPILKPSASSASFKTFSLEGLMKDKPFFFQCHIQDFLWVQLFLVSARLSQDPSEVWLMIWHSWWISSPSSPNSFTLKSDASGNRPEGSAVS